MRNGIRNTYSPHVLNWIFDTVVVDICSIGCKYSSFPLLNQEVIFTRRFVPKASMKFSTSSSSPEELNKKLLLFLPFIKVVSIVAPSLEDEDPWEFWLECSVLDCFVHIYLFRRWWLTVWWNWLLKWPEPFIILFSFNQPLWIYIGYEVISTEI